MLKNEWKHSIKHIQLQNAPILNLCAALLPVHL